MRGRASATPPGTQRGVPAGGPGRGAAHTVAAGAQHPPHALRPADAGRPRDDAGGHLRGLRRHARARAPDRAQGAAQAAQPLRHPAAQAVHGGVSGPCASRRHQAGAISSMKLQQHTTCNVVSCPLVPVPLEREEEGREVHRGRTLLGALRSLGVRRAAARLGSLGSVRSHALRSDGRWWRVLSLFVNYVRLSRSTSQARLAGGWRKVQPRARRLLRID
eukprot:scaffold1104_cov299-Prasinococcus_capsulatus_cf.AAC.12